MRLLSVIIAAFFFVLVALGIVYFWGLGQIFPKYENNFFEHKKPWLIAPSSFTDTIKSHADIIIWADVYRAQNQTLLVKDGSTLTNLIKEFPKHRIILNIISNVDSIDLQMADFVAPLEKNGQILIQSEYDVILRAMKEIRANLPYGSSQSDRLRFRTFEGMAPWNGGLLPATSFKNDVYISPLKWKNIDLVTKNLVQEIHRRQKWVFLGPLHTPQELSQAQSLEADAYYIDNNDLLNSALSPVAH